MKAITTALLLLILGVAGAGASQGQDQAGQPGAIDPLPGLREAGQIIAWQGVEDAPRGFPVPLGGASTAPVEDWHPLHGQVSRTYYLRDGNARWVEVAFRRQRDLLEREGFEIRAAGFTQEAGGNGIGSRRWLEAYLAAHPLPQDAPGEPFAEAQAQGAVIASREEPEGSLWAVVSILQPAEGQIGVLVDMVQTLRTTPPPPLSQAALALALTQHGRAVLDGLSFTEAGALDPASAPVLTLVGRYLRANVRQSFRVVGHTDDSADLDQAARQSQARAEAVVSTLVNDHAIPRERLRAFGIGPLAPIFSNDTEAGRARNARVELVAGP